MNKLFWLTDEQVRRIEPYFPLSHGVPCVDDRRIVSGIIFVIGNGLRRRLTARPRRSTTSSSAGAGWVCSTASMPDWRPKAGHQIS